jgi:hypothetical protein
MRNIFIIIFAFLFAGSSLFGVDLKKKKHHKMDHHFNIEVLDHVDIDIDDGVLVISDENSPDYFEISEARDLFVNGEQVKLTDDQQKLVTRYYDVYFEIIDYAKRIGLEGARIGVEGAAIGVKAVAGVFKLLRADYDSDDLEEELEAEAEKIEEKADRLEDRADYLEELGDELEELHLKLGEEIPELSELEMFQRL